MPPIDLTTRPIRPSLRFPLVVTVVIAALLGATLVALIARAVETSEFVPRVTFVNDTPYALEVDVRESADEGRMLMGRVLPEDETVRQEVADVGDQWLFSFNSAGVRAGELTRSRSELERDDWRVAVPDSIEARLRDAGMQPYPEEGER